MGIVYKYDDPNKRKGKSSVTKEESALYQKNAVEAMKDSNNSGFTPEEAAMFQKAVIKNMQEANRSINNKTIKATNNLKNNNPYKTKKLEDYLFDINSTANQLLKKSNGSLNNNITEGMNEAGEAAATQLLQGIPVKQFLKKKNNK
jgi:hypothetical protein